MTPLTLEHLADIEFGVEQLSGAGASKRAAGEKAELLARSARSLINESAQGVTPAWACYVPGRIEVLGKHTDYAGGRSLLAAPERGICMVAVARQDSRVTIRSAGGETTASFSLSPALVPTQGTWTNYPMTVARRLAQNFPGGLRGADVAFAGDLPMAAGMSSSSALMTATLLLLAARNRLDEREEYRRHIHNREELAEYVGCVENGQSFGALAGDRGVGTFGGSEDHTAMFCARPGLLKQYSYCPVRLERTVALPADYTFVIASSGVVAEKTGAAMEHYNRLSAMAAAIVELWCRSTGRHDPHLAAALSSSAYAGEWIRDLLRKEKHEKFTRSELAERYEHFLAESEQIVVAVPDRLSGDNLEQFGSLVDRSQQLATRLLRNQVPETIWLAEHARVLGAAAATAFGAGLGGSVWALVRDDAADEFRLRLEEAYAKRFPDRCAQACFFTTKSGPPAICLGASACVENEPG